MSDPARVLCVDDSAAVAEAVRCLVEMQPNLLWVGHLQSADDLVGEAERLETDIVLLDLDLPGRPAFEALEELMQRRPDTRAIILSGFMSEALVDRAFDAGAWGYVNKNDGPDAIIAAIRRVQRDEFALDLNTSV